MQKWHSLRFYIARIGVTESCDLICILKLGRELLSELRKRRENWPLFTC